MKIKELLDSPEKWTKGYWAKTKEDENISPLDIYASKWCLVGAVRFCYQNIEYNVLARIKEALNNFSVGGLTEWNDAPERTFEEVKALVNKLDI